MWENDRDREDFIGIVFLSILFILLWPLFLILFSIIIFCIIIFKSIMTIAIDNKPNPTPTQQIITTNNT